MDAERGSQDLNSSLSGLNLLIPSYLVKLFLSSLYLCPDELSCKTSLLVQGQEVLRV